ncbi:MAG TPA: acyl-CoA thioesterase domain-containing protein [Jatrophihabitans sp.]|jgi:acyl-CoA thioesterase-2|uniref:acyl-CoA thioesterase n=1 Tax=Jatrophihabitans sp. TaxID=1932789 RepID=UPI002DFD20BB|nr:acyl-CoA thioesterase domain-containing protein [Jatrophihabitans sp.]
MTDLSTTTDAVLAALDLDERGAARFRGDSIVMGMPRVFGGQVLAQALVAAGRTVATAATAHSLHAYFLRAGDPYRPIDFDVTHVRDGRRLSVRAVTARQGERVLATMTASFAAAATGVSHQVEPPPLTDPEALPTLAEYAAGFGGLSEAWSGLAAIDCRIDPSIDNHVWLRLAGERPVEDVLLQQALLVYLSDVTTLAAALVQHGIPLGIETLDDRTWDGVSLDHAVWFHRPTRADDWLLFAQSSPSAADGRAFTRAEVFDRSGSFVASVAQEGLFIIDEKGS